MIRNRAVTGRVRDSGASGSQASLRVSSRVHGYDVIRGLAVISMVGFHFCYDLATLKGASIPWFRPPFQDVWRASISWTFLIVAGVMCSYSRSNLRRGVRYLVLALVIFAVTTIAAVDTPISFGIIYCMGASTLCAWALDSVGAFPRGPRGLALGALVFAMLFFLCLGVPSGTIGFAPFGGPFLRLTRVPLELAGISWASFQLGGLLPSPFPFRCSIFPACLWGAYSGQSELPDGCGGSPAVQLNGLADMPCPSMSCTSPSFSQSPC